LPYLRQQVETRLAEEKRIARYIPDVFVETHDTKYHARCFAHPSLFIRRIAEWFDRVPLDGLNRLARMSGVPPVELPRVEVLAAAHDVANAAAAARAIMRDLDDLEGTLTTYSRINRAEGAGVPRD